MEVPNTKPLLLATRQHASTSFHDETRKRLAPNTVPTWKGTPSMPSCPFDSSDVISFISIFIQLMFYQQGIQQSRKKVSFCRVYILEEKIGEIGKQVNVS